jgi:hypothetical protein
VQHAATEITAPDTDNLPAYWQFHEAVARAQLAAWLPAGRRVLVDVSGPRAPGAELAAKAGHSVLRCIGSVAPGRGGLGGTASPQERGVPGGRPPGPALLVADLCRLPFLADSCADGVIADDRALSMHLAAETMIAEIARVLRPGGRVLACVDSLVLGMAVLADQHHWAHLVDLPHAEVVLVPWPDGSITRCYGPDQARELFTGAGLKVHWIRPRTALSESTVTHLLQRAPDSLPKLVRAELAARSDSSLGAQLVISASKPRARKGLAVPFGVLGLAVDAAGRVGTRVQSARRDLMPAVDALAVAVVLDAGQRGEDAIALAAGRQKHRLGPVGLGQGGPRVGRVLRVP